MRRRHLLGAVGGGAVLVGGGVLGFELFAPERATRVDEDLAAATPSSGGSSDAAGSDTATSTDSGSGSGSGGDSTDDDSGTDGDSGSGSGSGSGTGVRLLETGEFVGKATHTCSGTAELVADEEGLVVRFIDYEQTQGPDVFCYLTEEPEPETSAGIASGDKLLIDGGADGAEITKTGTFTQRVPDDFELGPAEINGVGVWCDDFRVPFGAAALEAA
jgi:hypothetical protein